MYANLIAIVMVISATSAPSTSTSAEADLRRIIRGLQDQAEQLKVENENLKKQLAAMPARPVAIHPYREWLTKQIKATNGEKYWSKKDIDDQYKDADTKDGFLNSYLLAHADLPADVINAAKTGRVVPEMPADLLKVVSAGEPYTKSESSDSKHVIILLWKPLTYASDMEKDDVYVVSGKVESVSRN